MKGGLVQTASNLDLVSKEGYAEIKIAIVVMVGGVLNQFGKTCGFNGEEEGEIHGITLLNFLDNLVI